MMEKEVEKFWGMEIWLVNTDLYCGKKLILDKGKRCSMHYHKIKDETFYIESGKVLLEIKEEDNIHEEFMTLGESYRIKQNTSHRFNGLEDSVIIEISTHHEDEDSYREENSGNVPEELKLKYNLI